MLKTRVTLISEKLESLFRTRRDEIEVLETKEVVD